MSGVPQVAGRTRSDPVQTVVSADRRGPIATVSR